MTATNMCYNFVGFRYSPPPLTTRDFLSLDTPFQIYCGFVYFLKSKIPNLTYFRNSRFLDFVMLPQITVKSVI